MEANHVEVSNKTDDLMLRLLKARFFIHSTLSLEYGLADEPSEPQLTFYRFQVEVVEKEEALTVATIEVGTLQALPDTERKGYTSSPSMERELVCLRHLYNRLREVTGDLGFDAIGLLRIHIDSSHQLQDAMQGNVRQIRRAHV